MVILFSRNTKRPDFCPVKATYSIFKRSERLQQKSNLHIAIYLSPTRGNQTVSYITSPFLTKQLRLGAKSAHGLTARDNLKNYTTFSQSWGMCFVKFYGKTF